jgi:hypothetical protein
MMLKAYTLETTLTEQRLTRFTGKDSQMADIVKMRLPGAGEGYMPNSRPKQDPKLVRLNGFEVKFNESGVPFTL